MATYKDLEDGLKSFLVQEQSDAHNVKTANVAKYNNIKISMSPAKSIQPHVTIRISISEATFSLRDFTKMNGGLGYEERIVLKWFGRYGIKEKLTELWASAEKVKEDK
ncbi:hypothetical protein IJD34_03125 [bacterium]|nr:hypothetical protein [bacterium]